MRLIRRKYLVKQMAKDQTSVHCVSYCSCYASASPQEIASCSNMSCPKEAGEGRVWGPVTLGECTDLMLYWTFLT